MHWISFAAGFGFAILLLILFLIWAFSSDDQVT